MIESKDIKKMVQHILKRDKGIADTQIMHPTREWFIGLGITLVIIAVGSWFCFYLYTFYTQEMNKEVVIIEQAVPYQAAIVKEALEVFAVKQQKYNQIVNGGDIVDTAVVIATTTQNQATTTPTTPADIPELIVDPAPIFEDDGTPIEATLAP